MKIFKNNFKIIFTAMIMTFFTTITTFAQTTPYNYKIELEDGISFVHRTIYNFKDTGHNQETNYIELDFSNPNINLALIKPDDLSSSKDTLLNQLNNSKQFKGKNIIGGINGEFFQLRTGQPLFTTISNGEIYSITDSTDESLRRPVFYIDENKNYDFDFLTINGVLSFSSGIFDNLYINSINKQDSYNDTNVSTYKINEESTYYPHEGLPSRYMLIELSNSDGSIYPGKEIYGKVIEVGEMNSPKKIERNQLLITSYGDDNYYDISYGFLNSVVSLRFDIYSYNRKAIKNDIVTAFTGHEYLIKNGEKMDSNYYSSLAEPSLINSRRARSALGVTRDNKLILFTVDESNTSLGMTLDELASHLESLGIVNAINLDGGGSTSISFENNEHKLFLMNDPDKYQREITNAVAVIYNK